MVNVAQTHIIIVAAGTGNRFGSTLPKQFHLLDGRPVLMRAIDAFVPYGMVTVVLSADMTDFWHQLCLQHGFTSPHVVTGGATRFESVRNALTAIDPAPGDVVLVHDGARPLVSDSLICRVIEALSQHEAVVPAVAVTDSLRRVAADLTSCAVDRAPLRAVQTPQGFRADLLTDAYRQPYRDTFTDDASVAEAAGASVAIVDGDRRNIKITSPDDIAIATALLRDTSR